MHFKRTSRLIERFVKRRVKCRRVSAKNGRGSAAPEHHHPFSPRNLSHRISQFDSRARSNCAFYIYIIGSAARYRHANVVYPLFMVWLAEKKEPGNHRRRFYVVITREQRSTPCNL